MRLSWELRRGVRQGIWVCQGLTGICCLVFLFLSDRKAILANNAEAGGYFENLAYYIGLVWLISWIFGAVAGCVSGIRNHRYWTILFSIVLPPILFLFGIALILWINSQQAY